MRTPFFLPANHKIVVLTNNPYPFVMHELVHSSWPEGGANYISNGNAGIDIADQLGLSLTGVCAFFKKDDLGLLQCGWKSERRGIRSQ